MRQKKVFHHEAQKYRTQFQNIQKSKHFLRYSKTTKILGLENNACAICAKLTEKSESKTNSTNKSLRLLRHSLKYDYNNNSNNNNNNIYIIYIITCI